MPNQQSSQNAYKQAGVDIDAGNELVKKIKPHVKSTTRTGLMSNIGGFGALFDLKATGYKDPILVSGTDGVGTKLKIAINSNIHDTIGIDLVAMCVNDLIVQGAEPLFFLDYFATSNLNVKIGETIISGIAEGCRQSGCALIGGETAEMPGMYQHKDYDLAGFVVGAVEREDIITGNEITAGDVILGLASSGIHSNGYSLVRKIINDNNIDLFSPSPFTKDISMARALLAPTKIYVKPLLEIIKENPDKPIKGMIHITGGGFIENIPRVVPNNLTSIIDASSFEFLPIFKWLKEKGNLDSMDMARTFNCGIGMMIICKQEQADNIKSSLQANGETIYKIGHIEKRQENQPKVIINNIDSWDK